MKTKHEFFTENRCKNALKILKQYYKDKKINRDDYFEFITLIGALPQLQEERDKAMKQKERR